MAASSQASVTVDFEKAINEHKFWKASMTDPAAELEKNIASCKAKECSICERIMNSGVREHICSHTHWQKLWARLSLTGMPSNQDAGDWNQKWVQTFVMDNRKVLFNHVTGDQKEQGGNFADVSCNSVGWGAASPASKSSASTATANPPSTLQRLPAESRVLPLRKGIDYTRAMNNKQDWKEFMDEPAQQLEDAVSSSNPAYSTQTCFLCQTAKNGVKLHITSQKHWSKLWTHLGSAVPSAEKARSWDSSWVESISTPSGEYLFNHLTGEQGLRSALMTESAAPSALDDPEADRRPFEIDIWLWQLLIKDKAVSLQQRLKASHGYSTRTTPEYRCDVCMSWMADVAAHLQSAEHLANLRIRMNYNAPDSKLLQSGPWVQTVFTTNDGNPVHVSFNHLSGEIL